MSRLYSAALALWFLAIFVPFDICFRSGPNFMVRVPKVIMTHRLGERASAAAAARGLVENQDFVVVDCDPWPLVPAKRCLLIVWASGR